MGGRVSAQNWYRDRRSRLSGEASPTRKNCAVLKAGKNGNDKLDISLLCRILAPDCRNDCEISVCADDKPTKCYHVWQKILYAPLPPLPESLIRQGYPLFVPRRLIIPSKKKNDKILLGSDTCVSLYVNGNELPGGCSLDKNFVQGLSIIIDKITEELPHAEFSQRLASPQNKGKLLKYFSRDFVENIEKEYSYGVLKLKLPGSMNHHNV